MRIVPLGDSGLLVEMGPKPDELTAERVRRLHGAMEEAVLVGVTDLVPSYTTVGVHFDLAVVGRERVKAWVEERANAPVGRKVDERREVVIPVCYGGSFGLDLEEVAGLTGLEAERVVKVHAAGKYTVRAVGFVPGFAYLAGLDRRLNVPRRGTPRARVPAGSVAIAAGQAGVYPIESPGGWQVIGRTPLAMFRPEEKRVSLLQVGDRVRFEAISRERFDEMVGGR